MAEKDVLSQEEIDALLTSVDDEDKSGAEDEVSPLDAAASSIQEAAAKASIEEAGDGQFKVINFTSQERIVRGELPVLEKIHDRAIKLFSNDIYQLMGKDLTFNQDPLQIIKHHELIASLPNPTLTNVFRFRPLRGKAAIMYDAVFVYNLVDNYYGGSSQFTALKDRFDFTATELSVMESVTKALVKNIELAWQPIIRIEATKLSEEMNPQLVHFSEPNELLLVSKFNLDFGKEKGAFSVIFPYSMVEPIKQRLEFGASRPDDEIDPNWIMSLREEIMEVPLTISASMRDTESTIGKVLDWKVDDFIPLEMKEVVVLDIEGTRSYTSTLGRANDMRAVKIIKRINH